ALTKGKSTDKEKFDAIYAWVATNIRYNFREYYSSSGTFAHRTSYILKTKRAVCLGYANLMDTLLGIAGILNTTVSGYAKDELFDVHDSIYLDNHAWSAVKLEGLWYLYDITWSTGSLEYEYKPFSKFLLRVLDKHQKKYKKVSIGPKLNLKKLIKSECKNYSSPAYYYKQKLSNRMLLHFLSRFNIKIRQLYNYNFNLDYYLSDPKIFAITHYPDHPIWALDAGKSMHDFEGDSAYYFLQDSVMENQVHEGKDCPACDAFLSLPEKDKVKDFETKSFSFNHKNQFTNVESEFELGKLNFKEAKAEPVDTIKLLFIDSAQKNYQSFKRSLQLSKRNIAINFTLQKNKNKKKLQLLLTENKQHKIFIRKKIKQSIYGTRSYKEVGNKTRAFATTYRKKARLIDHINTNFKTYPPRESRRLKIEANAYKLEKTKQKLDFLYTQITTKEEQFDSIIASLSLNIWQQSFGLDSLTTKFGKRIRLRRRGKDNYKKVVEDQRKKIVQVEFNYKNSLDNLVYNPSIKAVSLFNDIYKLIKLKNKLEQDALATQRDLVKDEEDPMSELINYKTFVLNSRKSDYCWLDNNSSKVSSVYLGFKFLHAQQDYVDLNIIAENNAERNRHSDTNLELKRRYRQYNSIISNNLHIHNLVVIKLKKYKREVIKRVKKSQLKKTK
ncbi:MAG TPA: transglutaminase-like domain-containing protein, partial [Bacteroidia bacterium]|nr:transglutaminase-like domain-containing protein [Bacteroidia bacterium]